MEFRPQQYDYHRKRPTHLQREKRQRLALIGCIVGPIGVLAIVIYFVVLHHQ